VIAELRNANFLKFFSFLTSYTGLGVFYVFVGGLTLSDDAKGIILGGLCLVVGILYIVTACTGRQLTKPVQSDSSV
jgi:COPI associated protein